MVRLLRFSKQKLNESQGLKYYNCYIKPFIEYGVIVYGCVSKIVLEPIFFTPKTRATHNLQQIM